MKTVLSEEPVLKPPEFERQFNLQVDASDRGLGVVLSQLDDNGNNHPIMYLSRKLFEREENYPTVEKECLSIVWAVQQLSDYPLGK